jgi:lysozyme
MAQRISQLGIDLIKSFESCSLEPYRDPVKLWTIGWGHLCDDQDDPPAPLTQEQADALLQADLAKFEQGIVELVKVPLTQHHFDALISLAFNIGLAAFKKSTLLKLLNEHRYGAASDQFKRWTKAGAKTLPGLVRRREAERDLFLRPEIKERVA